MTVPDRPDLRDLAVLRDRRDIPSKLLPADRHARILGIDNRWGMRERSHQLPAVGSLAALDLVGGLVLGVGLGWL